MSKAVSPVVQAHIFDWSPEEIRNVRAFVGQFVDGFPMADDVILLSSELATNAVLHSASGDDGSFFVLVLVEREWVRVEVRDLGSATEPTVRRSHEPDESGVGLSVVEIIADRWGFYGGKVGRVVWFEMDRQ